MPSVTPSLVTHAFARVRPVGALWRLRGYLKPYRTQMIVMFAAALGAVTAELVIPLLTKAVVDGAIAHHDKRLLIPLALAAVGLGASEGLLNMIRRWIQAGAVANIEKAIRDDLYAHLQRLQASFHDDWQSGQLLSRATTDLSSIRRFAGFGLIFLVTKPTANQFSARQPPSIPAGQPPSEAVTVTHVVTVRLGRVGTGLAGAAAMLL
jgi:ABC-type multidrug transport system fused ATPase/permease subunit